MRCRVKEARRGWMIVDVDANDRAVAGPWDSQEKAVANFDVLYGFRRENPSAELRHAKIIAGAAKKTLTQAEIEKTISDYIARGDRAEDRRDRAKYESAEYWKQHDIAVKWWTRAEALMPGGSHWAARKRQKGRPLGGGRL
jgi:hypothetical protein